jgi:hypothetical protein
VNALDLAVKNGVGVDRLIESRSQSIGEPALDLPLGLYEPKNSD